MGSRIYGCQINIHVNSPIKNINSYDVLIKMNFGSYYTLQQRNQIFYSMKLCISKFMASLQDHLLAMAMAIMIISWTYFVQYIFSISWKTVAIRLPYRIYVCILKTCWWYFNFIQISFWTLTSYFIFEIT